MNTSELVLILIILLLVLIFVYGAGNSGMVYTKSDVDGEFYLVRNKKDKKTAANLLAKLKQNILKLCAHLNNKINDPNSKNLSRYTEFKPHIEQLVDKFKYAVIRESSTNTVYTSYTINKGEQIIFCIRSKDISNIIKSNDMHNINLIMYVALHEISHVACPEYNHTPLFKKIFRFFCEEAINIGIYTKIDFALTPVEYCGMYIDDSII